MTALIKLTQGVWREADQVADLAAHVAAIMLACPPGTVIAGVTAARLHGLWLPSDLMDPKIDAIIHPEISRPSARCSSRRPALHARRRMLRDDEITTVGGLRVTTEARTWFELAARLPLADLVAAGDSALRGSAELDEIDRIVRRAGHRPGVVRARQALPLLDARSRSRPESHLRIALVTRGLPAPAVNVAIRDAHGGWLAEPDLSYDDVRLALEYNGALHADVDRMRKDLTRGVGIIGAGWRCLTVGPVEVFRHPDELAVLVRQLRADPLPRLSGAL